jgi:23S rRNA pseudouridine1911/1915/1917 synthase
MNEVKVIYEDNHLIAVNKKPGDISQGDKTGDEPLVEKVKHYLKEKYNKPGNVYLGLVHRIDRPVSGVLLFAKTSKASERMGEIIQQRQFNKTYWAVVKNKPEHEEALLKHYLVKNEFENKSFAYNENNKRAKEAILHYKLIAAIGNYFMLEVKPETGRHHQIRVQLAKIGCPVKGDIKYGYERTNKDGSIHLHARLLEFMHPIKKDAVQISADPPGDVIWNTFMQVGLGS